VDKPNRHRGAKLRPKFVLPGEISLFNFVNIKNILYFHFSQNGSDYVFIYSYFLLLNLKFAMQMQHEIKKPTLIYLLPTQPLIPKAPIRYLDFNIEYCTFDLTLPLNITVDNPLKEESTFFRPPFHFT
jgi:hypothetical protein